VTQVVFSIGSNLGDRRDHLAKAVAGLAAAGEVQAVSGVYETAPWGDPDQPAYLNAVVLATGPHTVEQWLRIAQGLEAEAKRERDPERRFAPRTLDVDLIAAWAEDGAPIIQDDPALTLPHPRAHQRAFVLRPWLEIQPYAKLPGHGWVNDLVLSNALADEVTAMTARPDIQLQSTA
jgi:2-amino-4-hydroxy-6-hydroxymethyldihydropteridine diphosphokinase